MKKQILAGNIFVMTKNRKSRRTDKVWESLVKEIRLDSGSIIKVDDEDYAYITECYDLYISKGGYVQCKIKKKFKYKNTGLWSSLSLHKLLMNPEKTGRKITVDHIDGNKRNNQKLNLRTCTHTENMRNRVLNKENHTSSYKGVHWQKKLGKWMVQISVNGELLTIGVFLDEIAAANAYNYYAEKFYGEFVNKNDAPYMPKEEWEKCRNKKNKTSKYQGVSKYGGKWIAQIWNGKQNKRIGEFDSEVQAALAYNTEAIRLRGIKAKINTIVPEKGC
jgi:HNH endonuclease/AP2 domain